jgi:hypothetical protein
LWTVLPDGGGVEPVFQREGQRHSDLGAFLLYYLHLFCFCILFFCEVGTPFREEMLIDNVLKSVLLERLQDYNESNSRKG